jgi:hypothetical protein
MQTIVKLFTGCGSQREPFVPIAGAAAGVAEMADAR